MSDRTELYEWFYTQVLRLYPKEFRVDFGDEMRAVFVQAIEVCAGSGKAPRFLLCELTIESLNLEDSWRYTNASLSAGFCFVSLDTSSSFRSQSCTGCFR